ncbi:MAG: AAA family ATPase, partial [Candidatus Izemoplasma sp.]
MLSYISVKNFAIIENIEVDFKQGMTALTGETGAGKSLLIDAIGLLLGGRASSNIVRTGESKAIVSGVFSFKNAKINNILNDLGIEFGDNEIIIKREISSTNNNLIRVNNNPVTLQQLNRITSLLADIHTQHDTHRLINIQTYLGIVDGFEEAETEGLIDIYQESLTEYKLQLKELNRLKNSNDSLMERLDLMRFQVTELEDYNLDHTEKNDLVISLEKLRNHDKIYQKLNEAYIVINSTNALENFYTASKTIEDVTNYSDSYTSIKSNIDEGYFILEDAVQSLKNEIDNIDFDPRLLDENETRLNSLESLERKYRKSISEIIDYLDEIK